MKMPKLMRKLHTATKNSHFRVLSLSRSQRGNEAATASLPPPLLSLSPVPPRYCSTPALHTAAAPQPRRYDGACSPGRRLVSPNLDIVRGGAGTARPRRCLLCVMRSATIASTPTGQGARGVWGFVFPTQAKTLLEPWSLKPVVWSRSAQKRSFVPFADYPSPSGLESRSPLFSPCGHT